MKILVFGSGKMGLAIAWDLIRQAEVDRVGLFDVSGPLLQAAAARLNSGKIVLHQGSLDDREASVELLRQYDVAAGALSGFKAGNQLVETALAAGVHLVHIHGEYHRHPRPHELEGLAIPAGMAPDEYGRHLHQTAIERELTLLGSMGLAPGLTNASAAHGIRRMDTAESVIVRTGGIPAREVAAKYLFNYMITWSWEKALSICDGKVTVRRNGRLQQADIMSDYEQFRFQALGQDEALEAYLTPGIDSMLYTRPQLRECYEKTIRWPGYRDALRVLAQSGLVGRAPVEFKGLSIVPLEFTAAVIEPRVQARKGDADVCIMWNTVTGKRAGRPLKIDYFMWDRADEASGLSAMGRTTGFPCAIAAVMVAKGQIKQRGVLAPEDALDEAAYLELLARLQLRNIDIVEVCQES